ncbi:PTS system fructose subfamily IIA component [Thermodesulfatator indicus DSM 15286]|uniref:PTS system fructose subfamily IIA component n=1 Tax=Thermodesulfatator indicus (strain DSM 15286 / JCM 11887 / CIR29812) TaxID=667014 RepID=F8A987_THEID|nr:PTS fructose subfamily IIA component [Thermodesulfatator indicus]AEH45272.1 PTS system fructose subfamily IIA component [Thermodesulfatator indicus DSM 15286]
MTGIIIAGHGRLPEELVTIGAFILGKIENVEPISIDPSEPASKIHDDLAKLIKKTDQGQGIVILTDLFGGTPSNIALSFLKPGYIEVVSGVNLPMLIKAVQNQDKTPSELAQILVEAGRKAINQASEILS